MKKLAIIGIAVLGLTLTFAVAPAAARSGMTKAEYRALMLRSEGLNQKYGVVQVKGENYFARGVQGTPPTVASSTSDFEWNDVAIGGAGLLGLVAIAVGLVGFRRHGLHPRPS